ncbi:MAG: hypothetical protein JWR21_994 [Herminiimonas sp.]|nr:hypothetical protein [Herminiimonas sp.]
MGDASSSSVGSVRSRPRSPESRVSSEAPGRQRSGSAPPAFRTPVAHQPLPSPRSKRRVHLKLPPGTTPSPTSPQGVAGTQGSSLPTPSDGSVPKYPHVPAKLVEHIPAAELEKISRYLDWAEKEHEANLERLTCLIDLGDALQRVAIGGMEGWDKLSRGIRETWHGKPKGPNVLGPTKQSGVYYGWGAISAIKVATYIALFFKKNPALSTVALASTYSIAFPAGVHSITQLRDWLRNYTVSCKDYTKALSNMEGALRFIVRLKKGKASVADARAYRAFTAACSKIPAVSPLAALDKRKTTAAAIRDCCVLLGTVTTSMLAQVAVLKNEDVKDRGKLMIGAGACYLAQGVLDLIQGWFAERPRCSDAVASARKSLLNASEEGAIPLDAKTLRAANQTYRAHVERYIPGQVFETTGGEVRGAKGLFNVVVGTVSVANGISQTVYEKDTGPTSALIGTAAAFVSMAYMLFTATKMRRRGTTINETKYRQRQAQMLIARHSFHDLRRAIKNNQTFNLEIPKGTFDEQTGGFPTNEVVVRARDNEFLGLHLVATEIAAVIENGGAGDKAEVITCLRDVWGMGELNLQSMFLIAQATAPKQRLAFLKSCLAPVFLSEFRLADERRVVERPLKASIVAQLALDLAKDNEWSSRWDDNWYPVLKKKVVDTVGRDEFIIAVQKVCAERIRGGVGAPGQAPIAFLKHAANAARLARRKDYQAIILMSRKDVGEIVDACDVTPSEVEAFIALVRDYAAAEIHPIRRGNWGDATAVAAYHKRQADSASDRLNVLDALQKDPVAQALMVDSARLGGLHCEAGLADLLSRLDRRVSDARGKDSDSDSTVGSDSGESDDERESSLFDGAPAKAAKGISKKTQGTSNDNIDGDEESEIVVSDDEEGSGDSVLTEQREKTRSGEKAAKTETRLGDDLIDAPEHEVIPIDKPKKSERRLDIVRTMTERAKNKEREVAAQGGPPTRNRSAGENNPDPNQVG